MPARTVYPCQRHDSKRDAGDNRQADARQHGHTALESRGPHSGTVLERVTLSPTAQRENRCPRRRIMPVTGTALTSRAPKQWSRAATNGPEPVGTTTNSSSKATDGAPGRLKIRSRRVRPYRRTPRVRNTATSTAREGEGRAYVKTRPLSREEAFPNAINVPAWRDQVILRHGKTYPDT